MVAECTPVDRNPLPGSIAIDPAGRGSDSRIGEEAGCNASHW